MILCMQFEYDIRIYVQRSLAGMEREDKDLSGFKRVMFDASRFSSFLFLPLSLPWSNFLNTSA